LVVDVQGTIHCSGWGTAPNLWNFEMPKPSQEHQRNVVGPTSSDRTCEMEPAFEVAQTFSLPRPDSSGRLALRLLPGNRGFATVKYDQVRH
ncbi:MAG: hypothetical protein ACREP1_10130, partial [Rhodanobacteraceae bacterium]